MKKEKPGIGWNGAIRLMSLRSREHLTEEQAAELLRLEKILQEQGNET